MDVISIGELVRSTESEYIRGSTTISKYVTFSQHDTIERIEAYLNSIHISGSQDPLGRDKPFFNISVAAANIWQRATDIDRSNIRIRATTASGWLNSFAATVMLRDWMRRERFGVYLNEWGRVLARYGSAVTKVVENSTGLHINVVPWNRLICDSVDFESNVKIEMLDLTQAELRRRVKTHGYDPDQVKALINSLTTRKTMDRQTKDNKNDYIRLYEIHGDLSKSLLMETEAEKLATQDIYVQQMHVISYVEKKSGRKKEYEDFTLVAAEEKKDPYRIAHLIREDGRTLSIGAVEHLFEAQWMVNHSQKTIKDTLDVASLIIFQTADGSMVGRNVLTDMVTGNILVHGIGADMSLSQVNNSKPDIVGFQNFAGTWKSLGNEITGISEAMLGAQPKSGTAWRQTEALLNESYSLFELMTENKGLYLEDLLREFVLPHIRRQLSNAKEISAILEQHEIHRIDQRWLRSKSMKQAGRKAIVEPLLKGELPTQESYDTEMADARASLQEELKSLGNQRFFKPSEISQKTWEEQFKDLEWEVEIDITGEQRNIQEVMTTLNTVLKLVVTPGFEQNPKAQAIVGQLLELTGAMSPVEYGSIPTPPPPPPSQMPTPDTPSVESALATQPTV